MTNNIDEEQRKKALRDGMTMLAAVPAYRFEVTTATLDVYWMVLGQYDARVIKQAFEKAIAEERTCPTPATIRAHARGFQAEQNRTQPRPFRYPTPEEEAEIQRELQRLRKDWRANSSRFRE